MGLSRVEPWIRNVVEIVPACYDVIGRWWLSRLSAKAKKDTGCFVVADTVAGESPTWPRLAPLQVPTRAWINILCPRIY